MDENRNPESTHSSSSSSSSSATYSCYGSSGCSQQSDSSHAMLCTNVPAAELQLIEEMVDESSMNNFELAPIATASARHNVAFNYTPAATGMVSADFIQRDEVPTRSSNEILIFNDPHMTASADFNDAAAAGGRPIVNTSLIKLAAANVRGGGRSPLATVVTNNKNKKLHHNSGQVNMADSQKLNSMMAACNDETFFVFNSRLQQYYGKGGIF